MESMNLTDMKKKIDYSKFELEKYFELNENSPSGIVWKCPRIYSGVLNYDRVGKLAGMIKTFNKGRQSYWCISFKGKSLFIHKIVWFLINKNISVDKDIDHIDGNSLNNNPDNLREVLPIINRRNAKRKKDKELPSGVYYETLKSKKGTTLERFNCHITKLDGSLIKKNFSILKYGYEVALQLALQWRAEHVRELNTEGAGYTERHCT